jgi:protein pelota
MKIIHSNMKQGSIKVKIDSLQDLWYLSHTIEEEDLLAGTTMRKIKLGKEGDRSSNIVKKPVFLKIKVEKCELGSEALRASGTIVDGPEEVSKGSYHTFNLEENTIFTIQKPTGWKQFQIKRLQEATETKGPQVLICVMDREEATLALLKKFGFSIVAKMKGDVVKKADMQGRSVGTAGGKGSTSGNDFYSELIKSLQEYDERYKLDNIILASPAFWKEDLMKKVSDEKLKKKVVLATCSSADPSAINEVLKRQEVMGVLKQDKVTKEVKLVETLLAEIAQQGKASYGFLDVKNAIKAGAAEQVLMTNGFIQEAKERKKYDEVDALLSNAEKMKGNVHIISSEHEGGRKLDGLGGVGALLRYKMEYT